MIGATLGLRKAARPIYAAFGKWGNLASAIHLLALPEEFRVMYDALILMLFRSI